jgi:hypothetical protein
MNLYDMRKHLSELVDQSQQPEGQDVNPEHPVT